MLATYATLVTAFLALTAQAAPVKEQSLARRWRTPYVTLTNHVDGPFSYQLFNGYAGANNDFRGVLYPGQSRDIDILGEAQVIKCSRNLDNPVDTPFQFEYSSKDGLLYFNMSGKDGDPWQSFRRSMELRAPTQDQCKPQRCREGQHDAGCEYTTDSDYNYGVATCPVIGTDDAQLHLYIG